MQGLIIDYSGVLDMGDEDERRWRALIEAVKAKDVPVAILSNEDGDGAAAEKIREWEFNGTVDAVVLSGEIGAEKPERAAFQAAVAEVLAEKTRRALALSGAPLVAVAGGVAANRTIRAALEAVADAAGVRFIAPPLPLCTDNAAMIAWAGIERLALGQRDGMDLAARPRWPLDTSAAPMLGAGKRGAKA